TGPATVVAIGDAKPLLPDEDRQPTPALEAKPSAPPTTTRNATHEAASAQGTEAPGDVTPVSSGPTEPPASAAGSSTHAPTTPIGAGGAPVGRRAHSYKWAALVAIVVLAGAVAAVIAMTSGSSSSPPVEGGFAAAVRPVPTNRV